MQKQEYQRAVVVSGLRAGLSPKDIIQLHNIPKTAVFLVRAKYKKHIDAGRLPDEFTGQMKTRQFVPRVWTPGFVRELEDLINHDPGRSMRSLAEAMNTSHVTIQACVEEDIKYRYYALCKGQFMSEKNKKNGLRRPRSC